MIKKLAPLFLAALTAFSLAACAGAPEASTETMTAASAGTTAVTAEASTAAATEASAAPATSAAVPETSSAQAQSTEAEPETGDLFWKDADGIIFVFTSGVGGWETSLKVNEDGSFTGEFYDMNMGETGEDHENGTVYECYFTGRFGVPAVRDEFTLLTEVEELDFEQKESYIEDKILYIPTWPYGIGKGDEVVIYLPGSKTADFSEEFMSWAYLALPPGASETGEILLKVGADDFCFFPDHYAMGDSDEFYSGEEWDSTRLKAMKKAYEDQKMPEEESIPYVPEEEIPAEPYESVTLANLQGSWVNVYNENGSVFTEILTVNGNRGKMVTLRDNVVYGVWNGEGSCSIEDRSAEGKCPAFRIMTDDGNNLCTIYIRWVNGSEFFDGGFLNSWYYVEEDEPDTWLYDTVTLDSLQGVWYGETNDENGRTQTVINIKGNEAEFFRTVNGVPDASGNGKGTVTLKTEENGRPAGSIPELTIDFNEGMSKGGSESLYISLVDYSIFYDAAAGRYFVKVF